MHFNIYIKKHENLMHISSQSNTKITNSSQGLCKPITCSCFFHTYFFQTTTNFSLIICFLIHIRIYFSFSSYQTLRNSAWSVMLSYTRLPSLQCKAVSLVIPSSVTRGLCRVTPTSVGYWHLLGRVDSVSSLAKFSLA